MQERHVIALDVMHGAAHPRVALENRRYWVALLGRLALGPVPAAAVLQVHDVQMVAAHDGAAGLETRSFAQLRAFSNTCGPMIAEPIESTTPPSRFSTAPQNCAKSSPAARPITAPLNSGWLVMMFVPDARMDRGTHVVPEGVGEGGGVPPAMVMICGPG